MKITEKAFTLIEIMIVIAVIGVLASVLYPSVSGYLWRASVTKYQNFGGEMIHMIGMYRSEVGELGDFSCFSESPDSWCSGVQRDAQASLFITKNSPKLHALRTSMFTEDPYLSSWYENISLPSWASYGYVFPGKDMTSTQKIPTFIWTIPHPDNFPSDTWLS